MDALEQHLQAKDAEITELKQAMADLQEQQHRHEEEQLEQLTELDDLEMELELESSDTQGPQPVAIHGFFDLSFYKFLFDEGSPYALYAPRDWSFAMSNLNLYFSGQMSPSLSSLIEIKFNFLPHGVQESLASQGRIGETVLDAGTEYLRQNTSVSDPHTTVRFNYGSITIERAHLTYKPFDWLKVLAGRFLTPYGIWNVDHGSTVIIPIRPPYMQVREMVPLAQTGLQIFGRFFPMHELFVEYAVTVSNGRGPIEELVDLDENKGLGLKLRLSYEGDVVEFALGGYGYMGTYTDIKKTSILELNPDLTINTDAEIPLASKIDITESYDEYIVTGDFRLSLFGVSLQGEAVWQRMDVDQHALMQPNYIVLSGAAATEQLYSPSDWGWGVYGLLSWQLPLTKLLYGVRITPYVLYEHNEYRNTLPSLNFDLVYAGLNIKPSPFVVLKVDYSWAIPQESKLLGGTINVIDVQMAVSF